MGIIIYNLLSTQGWVVNVCVYRDTHNTHTYIHEYEYVCVVCVYIYGVVYVHFGWYNMVFILRYI